MRWLLLPIALVAACSRATPPPVAPIEGVPFELTIWQRRTTVVPGTNGRLTLSIDDITRGQTHATLRVDGELVVLDARSMQALDAATFRFEGCDYVLRLDELVNNLIGRDSAQFSFRARPAAVVDQSEEIERLIASIEKLERAEFIRNGSVHDGAEAAAHLRRKLEAAGDDVKTAEQFIETIASRSSLTGDPYEIHFDDGRKMTVAEFLRAKLAALK